MLKTVFMSPYSRVLPLWLPLIANAHTIPESMQFVLIVLVPNMTLGGSTMLRLWGATNMCVIYTICYRYTTYPIKCAKHLVLLCLFGVKLQLICRFLWVNSPVLLGLPQCQKKMQTAFSNALSSMKTLEFQIYSYWDMSLRSVDNYPVFIQWSPWLLKLWLSSSPGHHKLWYWLTSLNRSLSSTGIYFNRAISVPWNVKKMQVWLWIFTQNNSTCC